MNLAQATADAREHGFEIVEDLKNGQMHILRRWAANLEAYYPGQARQSWELRHGRRPGIKKKGGNPWFLVWTMKQGGWEIFYQLY